MENTWCALVGLYTRILYLYLNGIIAKSRIYTQSEIDLAKYPQLDVNSLGCEIIIAPTVSVRALPNRGGGGR